MGLDHHVKAVPNSIGFSVLLMAALCVGCGKKEESATPSVTQTANDAAADQTKTVAAKPTTGTSLAGRTNSGYAIQRVSAVRIGNQPGSDRIVFEFDDVGLPEWEVKYVDQPLLDCGSGEPVTVSGDAWLQITFRGAQAHTEAGEESGGPRRQVINQEMLHELVRTCDFEGEVMWVAGVVRPDGYTAQVLAEPSRLVIDVLH